MANRRMFSKEVVGSDQFLDLPVSSRELYFQLGMYADDDGFVTPKKVVRMVGSSDDDLKVLAAKGFIISFQTGVIVVRHWRENNYIQKDRYKQTLYKKELKIALEDDVYKMDTQNRLGESELGKNKEATYAKRPYYKGMEMRKVEGKWKCVPRDGGDWLEFTDKESEIEWRIK